MGIMIGIIILVLLFSTTAKKSKTYTPVTSEIYRTQIRQGHWERRITGYKLQRNFIYDQLQQNWNWTDQHMHRMGFQEYTLIPIYTWIWVSD